MSRRLMIVVGAVLIASAGGAVWWSYGRSQSQQQAAAEAAAEEPAGHLADATAPVKLSPQARKNLGLISKPLRPTTYWRRLEMPGEVVDRPGISDRGVVAPITGTVTQIHAFPGATVAPGAPLFTIRLVSESLHASQLELYKATREIEIAERQKKRLDDLAKAGALPQARIIEIENQIDRMQATVDAYRQDLQSRGLPPDRIAAAAKGEFITEMVVRAPAEHALPAAQADLPTNAASDALPSPESVAGRGRGVGRRDRCG